MRWLRELSKRFRVSADHTEQALKTPEVTEAIVDDVLVKLHIMLDNTEPKELKAT